MAKILRLHRTGSSTHEGWGRTGKIGKNEIDGPSGIQDPEGGRAERVAVAIPSPFARLHLVETALAYVGSHPGASRLPCITGWWGSSGTCGSWCSTTSSGGSRGSV